MKNIGERVKEIIQSLPSHVTLEAAAKTRTASEAREAVDAGVKIIGHNYIQQAQTMKESPELAGCDVRWHLIGHLQRNKARDAVEIFDMIESLDSVKLARALDKRCQEMGKTMTALIEINSAKEEAKSGVMPEDAEPLIREAAELENLRIEGLMTMGPFSDDPEDIRPYFRLTRELFDNISRLSIPNVEMKYLSMGMSDSYLVAIEEGANIVRLGTTIFGPRPK